MYISRQQESYLADFINNSQAPHSVLVIEGARQVGKTTFVNKVLKDFPDVCSFNLEEDKALRREIDNCNRFSELEDLLKLHGFAPEKQQILFIDEAQESEQLGGFVRFIKEKWLNTRTILSGSSMTRLFRPDQRIPVGRYLPLRLQPLSFYEFLHQPQHKVLKENIDSFTLTQTPSDTLHRAFLEQMDLYLDIGGLPEVVASFYAKQDYRTQCRAVLLNQEEDFVRKSELASRDLFMSGLRGVSNHLGGAAKNTHITQSSREGKQVISIMKAWHLIHEVEQKGISSTSKFHPKRYVYDIGIAQIVRNMPFPQLSLLGSHNPALRTQLGGLFENLTLLSLLGHKLGMIEISAYKENSKNKSEVDFIWRDRSLIPIECKATLKVSQRTFDNIRRYLNIIGGKVGFVISAAPFEVLTIENMKLVNLPIYLCQAKIIKSIFDELS